MLNQLSEHLASATESTIVRLISGLITFNGKWDDPVNGEHHIRLDNNVFFSRSVVSNGLKTLTQPQPDVSVGYILSQHAAPRTRSLFTEAEETVLLRHDASTKDTSLYPFLTGQITGQIKTTNADYEKAAE